MFFLCKTFYGFLRIQATGNLFVKIFIKHFEVYLTLYKIVAISNRLLCHLQASDNLLTFLTLCKNLEIFYELSRISQNYRKFLGHSLICYKTSLPIFYNIKSFLRVFLFLKSFIKLYEVSFTS